ncbi:THAP domain-containing protein isoform X1 [Danio rerio]|uniref:THAP domain-containing protein isoform X1 n=2 Tax=Danio rerio TaxID=7955 RepID=A0AC58ISG5_DANRE
MSCSALSCKNRPSPGTGISFHRFPLDDKDRLQKWLLNLRRDNFQPSPSARICSQHFEDGCFFTNNHGKLCLSKSAVPTLFYYPISFRSWRKYWSKRMVVSEEEKSGDGSRGTLHAVETTDDHHKPEPTAACFGTPQTLLKTEPRSRFVEVDVILNESIKEEDDDIGLDMPDTNVSPVIYPSEVCVVAVRQDHCYYSSSSNTDGTNAAGNQESESAEMLRHKLHVVLSKIKVFRKTMKIKNQMIRRLKSRVLSLKANVKTERLQREKMQVTLSKLQKDLDCRLQPKPKNPDL